MSILRSISFFAVMLLLSACQTAAPAGQANEATLSSQYQNEEFRFENDGVSLAATIITPKLSNGLGVVFLPGSGPAERLQIRPAAEQMAGLGVTVLIFDKRGSGNSEGDWTASSLDDLASDAITAMSELQARSGIDRIGLWAHSQGNWVAIRAADMGAKPDFLIAASGGGASPREVERHYYEQRINEFSPVEQTQAMLLVDQYFDYLSGVISRAELDQYIATARDNAWFAQLGIERVLVSENNRQNWQWVSDFAPAAGAESRIFPVLVLLGGADFSIPIKVTFASWNNQLAQNKLPNNRIVTFVGRDHHLRISGHGHGIGLSTDPVTWGEIAQWLGDLDL